MKIVFMVLLLCSCTVVPGEFWPDSEVNVAPAGKLGFEVQQAKFKFGPGLPIQVNNASFDLWSISFDRDGSFVYITGHPSDEWGLNCTMSAMLPQQDLAAIQNAFANLDLCHIQVISGQAPKPAPTGIFRFAQISGQGNSVQSPFRQQDGATDVCPNADIAAVQNTLLNSIDLTAQPSCVPLDPIPD